MVKLQGQTIGETSYPLSKSIRNDMLLKLIKVSKALQEIITTSTIKRNVNGLIKMLTEGNGVGMKKKLTMKRKWKNNLLVMEKLVAQNP